MIQAPLPAAPAAPISAPRLTRREVEILGFVAQGLTNVQIARECWISPNTVNVHVSRILTKLGVRTRTKAAMAGLRLGVLTLPD
jgi:DNA-binding NarL/FixJ family response regulator